MTKLMLTPALSGGVFSQQEQDLCLVTFTFSPSYNMQQVPQRQTKFARAQTLVIILYEDDEDVQRLQKCEHRKQGDMQTY